MQIFKDELGGTISAPGGLATSLANEDTDFLAILCEVFAPSVYQLL